MKNSRPHYNFSGPNENTVLSEKNISFDSGGNSCQGIGQAMILLLPKPKIVFRCTVHDLSNEEKRGIDHNGITNFMFGGKSVEVIYIKQVDNHNTRDSTFLLGSKCEPTMVVGDDNTQINNLLFHLFSFSFRNSHCSAECVLESSDWRLTIAPVKEAQRNTIAIYESGGYALTHTVNLQSKPDHTISGRDASKAIHMCKMFFSFANGKRCTPVCAVGYDQEQNVVWESFSSPSDSAKVNYVWFDHLRREGLTGLFPGFCKKYYQDGWKETLNTIIPWYLTCNRPSRNPSSAIVLAQAAMEHLSYQYFVNYKKSLTKNKFDDERNAAERIRMLFASLNIPIGLTGQVAKLADEAGCKWADSAEALIKTRNSIVHPVSRQPEKNGPNLFKIRKLGIWMLELAILRICGYEGKYLNRMVAEWTHCTEAVPWVKNHH